MKTKLFALAFLSLLLALTPIFGQAISGDVTGTVSDPSGAVLPGAIITIQNDQTGVKTTREGQQRRRLPVREHCSRPVHVDGGPRTGFCPYIYEGFAS